jgi:hypothetical protein
MECVHMSNISPDSTEDETECVGFANPDVTVITVVPDALPEEEPPENELEREDKG